MNLKELTDYTNMNTYPNINPSFRSETKCCGKLKEKESISGMPLPEQLLIFSQSVCAARQRKLLKEQLSLFQASVENRNGIAPTQFDTVWSMITGHSASNVPEGMPCANGDAEA